MAVDKWVDLWERIGEKISYPSFHSLSSNYYYKCK